MTARFPALSPDDLSEAQRRVAAEITSGPRGQLRGPFVPLIYSPDLASCVQKLGEYLRFNTGLTDSLLEIAILVTARQFHCPNIWHSHRALALKAGLDPAIIAAIAQDRRPQQMGRQEELIYEFASELVGQLGVSDQRFDRVVASWDRRTAMDLIAVCGYYALLAMVLNTARIPLPEGSEPFQS